MRVEWEVQGFYCGQWERLTTEETKADAHAMCKCYDENERQYSHRVKKRIIWEDDDNGDA